MSQTTISIEFRIDGNLVDATTAVLSDDAGVFGVKRNDTDAVVVADGTALTKVSTGTYEHTFEDPAPGLLYTYSCEFTYGDPSETYWHQGVLEGGSDDPNLYSLEPDIEPYVRGPLPEPVLRQVLRKVARDFCLGTEIWVEDLAPMVTVGKQAAYGLSVGSYLAYVHRVLRVMYDGTAMVVGTDTLDYRCISTHDAAAATKPITGASWEDKWELVTASSGNGAEWAADRRYQRAKEGWTGLSFKEVSFGADQVVLVSPPSEDGKLIDVQVVLLPTRLCTVYPAWLLERWGETIVNGTIGHLKAQMGKSWYDPEGAQNYLQQYRQGKGSAKGERLTRRGPGRLKVVPRRFV